MQTKIVLDDELIERAQKLTGIKSKNEAVEEALRALITLKEDNQAVKKNKDAKPQQQVVESLERSLTENAEVWSELAKR